jgi:hypothetical protein
MGTAAPLNGEPAYYRTPWAKGHQARSLLCNTLNRPQQPIQMDGAFAFEPPWLAVCRPTRYTFFLGKGTLSDAS